MQPQIKGVVLMSSLRFLPAPQYLTEKKVHVIFLELLKQVVAEKPDNVLSFLAVQAHNLHRTPPPSLTGQQS
jgi:hypothetical protein